VVINGAGAAGIATAKLLLVYGVGDVILCDRLGAIYREREAGMNRYKMEIARLTNKAGVRGDLATALVGADAFIGLSSPNILTPEMIRSMAPDPIVFALANPDPEIHPDLALEAGALVVATGRSDFPNQVNNSLAFPGVFRGALDVRARDINDAMKLAAAQAIAELVSPRQLSPQYVIPDSLDLSVPPAVAAAVARAAVETGVARLQVDPDDIAARTRELLYEGVRR
jgi:malate dehydrogenase (oxaloacetate-decarboxylating)